MPKKGKPPGYRAKSSTRRLDRKFVRTMNVRALDNSERAAPRIRHNHA